MAKSKPKTQDDKNINYLERRYMYEQRRRLYVANEEINQVWDESDALDFAKAWNNNWSMSDIAEYLGADKIELELLALDLIQTGKIAGNVHIFKPKTKKGVKILSYQLGEFEIRTVDKEEKWLCLKDVWAYLGKPDHSYRKTTENWGPDLKAKYKLQTKGGDQKYIFINGAGLDSLTKYVSTEQNGKIELLKGILKDGFQTTTETKFPKDQKE